jgi:hypothetical protein
VRGGLVEAEVQEARILQCRGTVQGAGGRRTKAAAAAGMCVSECVCVCACESVRAHECVGGEAGLGCWGGRGPSVTGCGAVAAGRAGISRPRSGGRGKRGHAGEGGGARFTRDTHPVQRGKQAGRLGSGCPHLHVVAGAVRVFGCRHCARAGALAELSKALDGAQHGA